jgi:hypothetical protein
MFGIDGCATSSKERSPWHQSLIGFDAAVEEQGGDHVTRIKQQRVMPAGGLMAYCRTTRQVSNEEPGTQGVQFQSRLQRLRVLLHAGLRS